MCGICGILGPDEPGLIEAMNELIRHRGPDDSGIWRDDDQQAALAMRRLSIIDLAHGHQPFSNEDGTVVAVFNGEIYNFKSLRAELINQGHTFVSHSDTEILVHGYEHWGPNLPARLNGMFAFAIFDRRSRTLFCARDRLGIKPFYYSKQGPRFIFASEQKPILKALNQTPRLNRKALLTHLALGFYTDDSSIFETIRQLPPAHHLTYKDGRATLCRYWDLRDTPRADNTTEAEAVARLKDLLARVVEEHRISDVPLGLTLSGGLDSSILAHLMANGPGRLEAFTLGFGHASDEIPFARQVSANLPLDHHESLRDPAGAIQNLPRIAWHLEEPLSNVTAITAYNWAEFVASHTKVALIGEGADEIMAGYFQYRLFRGPAAVMPHALSRRLFRFATLQPPLRLIKALCATLPQAAAELDEIFHHDYLGRFGREGGGLNGALLFDLEYELSNNQLLRVDRMTMAHGLEARVPFLDHRLVEFCWGLPASLKIRGRNQKYLLREAFRDVLPPAVIARPKIGPGGSQALFPILMEAGLNTHFRRFLLKAPALEIFDTGLIEALIEGRRGVYPVLGSRVRDKLLFALFMYALWHRVVVEQSFDHATDLPPLDELC